MKRRIHIGILIGCALLPFLYSCSVKEDRSACPCLIHIGWSKVLASGVPVSETDSVLVIMRGLHNSLVSIKDHPVEYTFNVKRTPSLLSCYMGMSQGRLSGGRNTVTIPMGEDGDRLFSYHRMLSLDASSEEEYVTPELCFEYTRVVLRYGEGEPDPGRTDKAFVAASSTCGLDLDSGKPLEGEFSCPLARCDSLSWEFIMPRQKGRDIRIDAISTLTGNALFQVDLAGELEGAGYQWDAESLPPLVVVNISEQNIPVKVSIIDWKEAVYFNYTL